MGYTNYYKVEAPISKDIFGKASKDLIKVIKQRKIRVAGGDGTGDPQLNSDGLVFNGFEDESYETFLLTASGGDGWFCKTNRLPYDLIVKSALLLLRHHGANIDFECDDCNIGDGEELSSTELWVEAAEACEEALGYSAGSLLASPSTKETVTSE